MGACQATKRLSSHKSQKHFKVTILRVVALDSSKVLAIELSFQSLVCFINPCCFVTVNVRMNTFLLFFCIKLWMQNKSIKTTELSKLGEQRFLDPHTAPQMYWMEPVGEEDFRDVFQRRLIFA